MMRSVEASRIRVLGKDIADGVAVLSDEAELNKDASPVERRLIQNLRPFDIKEFDNLLVHHIQSVRGRVRAEDIYNLRYIMLGGMIAFAVQAVDDNRLVAWLRMLHKADDELQSCGRFLVHYASGDNQPRKLIPSGVSLGRRSLTLQDSWTNLTRIMAPVLGPDGVNFNYIRQVN